MKKLEKIALVLLLLVLVVAPSTLSAQNLTVNSNASIIIDATHTSYGQLKIDGTISNSGTISQFQVIKSAGYASISSPMVEDFTTTSGDNTEMFYYDGAAYKWRTSHQAGRGYYAIAGGFVDFTTAGKYSVTGTPNTSITQNLSYTSNTATGGTGSGWNLVGNPYTCGLDWTTVTKTNVNNSFYIWDPALQLHKYYAVGAVSGTNLSSSNILTSIIPPMQAFYVEATSVGSLSSTMNASGVVDNAPTYISKITPDNLILGVVDMLDSTKNDAAWLVNNTSATLDFDSDYDARKMFNGATQPNIYSTSSGNDMAVNSLNFLKTPTIPVGFDGPTTNSYSISLEQIVNATTYNVMLEDKHTKIMHDLSSKNYTFKNSGWDPSTPRFLLHVLKNNAMDLEGNDGLQADDYYVYQDQQHIYVNQTEENTFNNYVLYDINGRTISSGNIQNQLHQIQSPTTSGIFILVLQGNYRNERIKMLVNN